MGKTKGVTAWGAPKVQWTVCFSSYIQGLCLSIIKDQLDEAGQCDTNMHSSQLLSVFVHLKVCLCTDTLAVMCKICM